MTQFKKVAAKGRLFFTTDIHGELRTLLKGLSRLGFCEREDTLVCAGDLIDRGRDSFGTAFHFINNSSGSYHTVLGNHDDFAIKEEMLGCWMINGGSWYLGLSETEKVFLESGMKSLPYAIEVHHEGKVYGVSHASVPVEFDKWSDFVEMLEQGSEGLEQSCTWDREFVEYANSPYYDKHLQGVDMTIHGHTPVKEPLQIANRLHIDTGLVYGKYLTIVEVVEGEMVSGDKLKKKGYLL